MSSFIEVEQKRKMREKYDQAVKRNLLKGNQGALGIGGMDSPIAKMVQDQGLAPKQIPMPTPQVSSMNIEQQAQPALGAKQIPMPVPQVASGTIERGNMGRQTQPAQPAQQTQQAPANPNVSARSAAIQNMTEPGYGQGYFASSARKPVPDLNGAGVLDPQKVEQAASDKAIAAADAAASPIYSDDNNGITAGKSDGKYGFSEDNNPRVASAAADKVSRSTNTGLGMPAAPRTPYGEESRRAAMAMGIRPYANMNGRLTVGQVALKNQIMNGDDEKYANERYTTQMNAAAGMTKTAIEADAANARNQLTEAGANERQAAQLGFDADKFKQSSALDERRVDIAEADNDIKNFAPKERNRLYKEWESAKTPEAQDSAIAKMNALLSDGSKSGQNWIAVKGGQTVENGAVVDGKPYLVETNSGATKSLDSIPIPVNLNDPESAARVPQVAAILNDDKTNYEQKQALIKELEAAGVIIIQ